MPTLGKRGWGQGFRRREISRLHCLSQVEAVDEFHQQEVDAVGLTKVVDRNDVRMIQSRQSASFTREALGEGWFFGSFRGNDFEGDEAVGWMPDGRALIRSTRDDPFGVWRLYSLSMSGGEPEQLPLGWAARLSVDQK